MPSGRWNQKIASNHLVCDHIVVDTNYKHRPLDISQQFPNRVPILMSLGRENLLFRLEMPTETSLKKTSYKEFWIHVKG